MPVSNTRMAYARLFIIFLVFLSADDKRRILLQRLYVLNSTSSVIMMKVYTRVRIGWRNEFQSDDNEVARILSNDLPEMERYIEEVIIPAYFPFARENDDRVHIDPDFTNEGVSLWEIHDEDDYEELEGNGTPEDRIPVIYYVRATHEEIDEERERLLPKTFKVFGSGWSFIEEAFVDLTKNEE